MEQNSNAEKQARYRKKEKLKRKAAGYLVNWAMQHRQHNLTEPQEVRDLVEEAIWLPPGWTDEDYEKAESKLELIYSEKILANQFSMAMSDSRTPSFEFNATTSPLFTQKTTPKRSEEDKSPLASHIISALKLSGSDDAEQATALMQAMQHVGKNLLSNRNTSYSHAAAICVTTVGPEHNRPTWLPKRLAETLSKLLHPNHLKELIIKLTKNEGSK